MRKRKRDYVIPPTPAESIQIAARILADYPERLRNDPGISELAVMCGGLYYAKQHLEDAMDLIWTAEGK